MLIQTMFFMKDPYSSYLPMEYKISTVSKYTKTCYLPYGRNDELYF